MNILLAVHHFPPLYTGGAEWRAFRTAQGLLERGHRVRVITVESISDGSGDDLKIDRTVFRGIDVERVRFKLDQTEAPFQWSYRNLLIQELIQERLRELHMNILHLISGYLISGAAIDAAVQEGVPSVLTLTDFWFLCPRITLIQSDGTVCKTPAVASECALCLSRQRRRYRYLENMTRGKVRTLLQSIWKRTEGKPFTGVQHRRAYLATVLERASTVISPAEFLIRFFKEQGIDTHHFRYMRQGLDVRRWTDANEKLTTDHLRVGYIGQIAEHKGLLVLLRAFMRLVDDGAKATLTLYGNVQQFPRFHQQLQQMVNGRNEISFAGMFDRADVRAVHADIDVLVVPSIWYEISPNVILEAFETRTPVIVSKLGGMAELVHNGVNGLHFKVGDSQDLLSKLQRFIQEPELKHRLMAGAPKVKLVDEEIDELVDLYAEVTSST